MLTTRICKLLTLDFLRSSEERLVEPVTMGQSCSKPPQMVEGTWQGQTDDNDDDFQYTNTSTT